MAAPQAQKQALSAARADTPQPTVSSSNPRRGGMHDKLWQEIAPWITNGIEGRKFELKREFPLEDRLSRAKLAKFITAIANAPGGRGYFIVGVVDARDRQSDKLEDLIAGVTHSGDLYQRLVQQALTEFTNPVPEVKYQEYSPLPNRRIGVMIIERSFSKPHEIVRESGDVRPGIYIRRGAETFQASRDDILFMAGNGTKPAIVVNLARPLTEHQLKQIGTLSGFRITEVICPPKSPVEFSEDIPFEAQIAALVDTLGLTDEEWQELQILVHAPGYAPIAATLIAELHGRMGQFPKVLRLGRSATDPNDYELAEVIHLQRIRDRARSR
jgi:schlafen family protein